MNTFREVQALILGYRAADEATRKRILQLVPDLTELVADVPANTDARSYLITLVDGKGFSIVSRIVVSKPEDLPSHVGLLKSTVPYATVARHEVRLLPDRS